MTIANPKTPEAAQRLVAELLEKPGALEGDLIDIQDDEPVEAKLARVGPPPLPAPVDIVVTQPAQLTGIEPPPVSKYIPPVLAVEEPPTGVLKSLPPIEVGEEDLLPIRDDESLDQATDAATAKPQEPDPVIEIRDESIPASVDVQMTPHGGPAEHTERERPPDFSAMLKPEFSGTDMRRKHPDGSYIVESDLLWKFLNYVYVTISSDHPDMSRAAEPAMKHRWFRAKRVAVVELFARGEAFRSLKGQQADQKRLIQVKDIEAIVGELTSLAEKEPDADRKRWLNESLKPAVNWIENQVDMGQKLAEKRELTTAGKTPHGSTPASRPADPAPPVSVPKPAPEPRQKGVTTPTKMHVTPDPADMTPPPEAVHTPPVAKKEATPAKTAEKVQVLKKPPEKKGWWKQHTDSYGSVVVAASIAAALFVAIGFWAMNEQSGVRSSDRIASTVKLPAAVKKAAATPPVVTPVASDACQTVQLAGVYGKPLSDKERGDAPVWDCSKQGHFTLLTHDTGKVCGCTFRN